MYCQNCGEKLEMENQRFCQNCGSEILSTDETPKPIPWEEQNKTTTKPIPIPQYETSFKKGGQAGSYSKRALGFGIVSLIIGLISLNVGSGFVTFPYLFYYSRVFIGLAIVHVVGLIFGIASRTSSSTAKATEPESSILKAGNVIGIIGLILNSILLIADIFLII